MSKFKSFAQSGSFRDYQLQAPDETAKIERETQRTLRGKQRAQDFLEENNRIYLRAQQLAQGREEAQREQNFRMETENRQAYKDALRRDFEIETQNDRAQAAQQEQTLKDLSSFSKTAFELYRTVDENITKNQTKDNAARAYAAGADLQTVASIQSLGDNLTRAEFAQQDFIRQKIEEGSDVEALFALYQNRSTRGFINNIAVAQNTAYAEISRIDQEMNAWSQANSGATVEQKRAHYNTLIREASANVGVVGERAMNADLLNQYVFPILRKSETSYLTQFDKEAAKARDAQIADDTTTALNQQWESGGASGILKYIYEDPSPEKFSILANWVKFKSKDLTGMGLSPEQIDEILDAPFPGPNLNADGTPQMTTLRKIRGGKEDVALMLESQRVARSNRVTAERARDAEERGALEDLIKVTADQFAVDGDGRFSAEEIRQLEELEEQIIGYESPTLAFIKESLTGDAQSDAVGNRYLEDLENSGNLTVEAVSRLPLSAPLKISWTAKAEKQESFFKTGGSKEHIDQIKAAIAGSPFVKIMPITGATSWTVKSYTAKRVALYKQLVAQGQKAGISADQVFAQVMQETQAFVKNRDNFDIAPDGDQTGEIVSELNAIKQGVGDFKLNTIQYKQFNQALSNPAFKTDAAYAGASMGADNIRNSVKMMEAGNTPDMVQVAARVAGQTPYEFINWVAEGAGMPGVQLSPIAQQMAAAAQNPVTRRLYTDPTPYRVKRANQINFGGGFNKPEIPVRGVFAATQPQRTGYDNFVNMARSSGAKFPELVAAQWALESAFGSAVSGQNNFFGAKATSAESSTAKRTTEVVNGQEVGTTANFKNYDSPQAAVNELVSRWYKDYKGYSGVNNANSLEEAAQMLQEQGYATDPNYAQKLIELANRFRY